MKLDRKALAVIKEYRRNGFIIADITKYLTTLGYKQKLGGELCSATVSHFMIKNGMRTYSEGRNAVKSRTTSSKPKPVEKKQDLLGLIEVIISNQTLSKEQKTKVIQAIL